MKSFKEQVKVLERLFDNKVKVRLLRMFLRNFDKFFKISDVTKMINCHPRSVKREIDILKNIKLLRSKVIKEKSKSGRTKKWIVYGANPSFNFYEELRNLVLKSSPVSFKELATKIASMGRVKLLILSGIFINYENARADMFLVVDHLKENKLKNFIKNLESEMGRELNYVIMTSKEFDYRYKMFDNFIRDILEGKNVKVIDKFGLEQS